MTTVGAYKNLGQGPGVAVEIDNLAPHDSLGLQGLRGGDFFGISPDVTGTFGIDVHDVVSAAVNTLFVAGDEYERRTFGFLHAFAQSGGVYVSNSWVYFTNTYSDFSHFHAVTTSSLVSFDGSITQLKVLAAPDIGNSISVGALNVASTTVTAGAQGDSFNVSQVVGDLTLNGGAGNDTFDINSSYSGNLTIDGKAGNDVVDLGDVPNETGTVYVKDTKGLVALTVNDVLDTQVRNPYIASNVITGFSPAFIWYEPAELASLTIDGTRGYIPFHRTGRFTTVPVINVYNVLSTPGYNRYGQLVTTTLITNGAGGDNVGVLAVAIPGAKEKGIVGTLVGGESAPKCGLEHLWRGPDPAVRHRWRSNPDDPHDGRHNRRYPFGCNGVPAVAEHGQFAREGDRPSDP